jgi:hypothetical protein
MRLRTLTVLILVLWNFGSAGSSKLNPELMLQKQKAPSRY